MLSPGTALSAGKEGPGGMNHSCSIVCRDATSVDGTADGGSKAVGRLVVPAEAVSVDGASLGISLTSPMG